ncbi:MAG: O-antigen ligase family protein [Chloroflexi bacterium]|nr:O-antigen ligase family protein [Chloroflexota bacterium]
MIIDEEEFSVAEASPAATRPVRPALASWLAGAAQWLTGHELWLLAVASPFLLFPNRWTPLAFSLIPLTWICRRIASGRFTLRTAMDAPIVILVVMSLVGYAVSADAAMSGAKVWGMVLQAAVFYGMVNGVRTQRGILRAAGALLVATIALAVVSLVGADWSAVRLVNLPVVYDHLPRLIQNIPGSGVPRTSELFNPREVGATMGLLLPLPIALLTLGRQRRLRLLSIAALVVGFIILLLAQSLQAFLGVAMALLLIAAWRNRWFLVALPAFLVALGAGLLVYGPQRAADTLLSPDHLLGIGVVLRLDIWSRALAMVRDMPYTGIGLNTFPLIQTNFYPGYLLGAEPHAHNLFLQTAVDLGLPGLAGLLGLLLAFGFTIARAHRATTDQDRRAILIGLAGGVLAYGGNGLVDTVTLGAKPLAVLWLGLGLAAACLIVSRRESLQAGKLEGLKVETPEPANLQTFNLPTEKDAKDNSEIDQKPAVARKRPVGLALRPSLVVLVPLALLAVLMLNAVVAPADPPLNLGSIRAHKMALAARSGEPAPAQAWSTPEQDLQEALSRRPGDPQTYGLLGILFAWQGNYPAAIQALELRAALDAQDPMGRYAPFEALRRSLRGEQDSDRWDDTLRVYSQWATRFPDRAETYAQIAVVWDRFKGDPGQAAAVLRSGLEKRAGPQGLLTYYLAQVEK